MKTIHSIKLREGSKEEILPDFSPDFPYIASRSEVDKFAGRFVPWHWHKEIELFYVQCGAVEYYTPKGKTVFPEGSAGLVNSNILHMTRIPDYVSRNSSTIHLFDASFLGGQQGSRIEQKYITPLITSGNIEIIPLMPDDPREAELIEAVRESFCILPEEYGYEMKLRAALSEIWCRFLSFASPWMDGKAASNKTNDKLKMMMVYIHEHFPEKITVSEIAASAFISERECFRAFQECLHMTPAEYLKSYRLQNACHMLVAGQESITTVCHACGLGSSSYFGKVFREQFGCTPLEYRRTWQDNDIKRQ